GLEDDGGDATTLAVDAPYAHPLFDLRDRHRSVGRRDPRDAGQADGARAHVRTLVHVIHAAKEVHLADGVVDQRGRGAGPGELPEVVVPAVPVQLDSLEVQPGPVDADDLV